MATTVAHAQNDGELDMSFDPGSGPDENVFTTAVQSDGKIIIGGAFTDYQGTPRNSIARIQPDGSLDASFDPGSGANGLITSTALQSDGKVFIGGYFFTYDGTPRSCIARLHPDGSLDTSFDPGTGLFWSSFPFIRAIVLQPDGRIIIGGLFSQYNGTPRNCIARIHPDGSLDSSFDPGAGADLPVETIAIQPDGKIILGGQFTQYNGVPLSRLARLHSDGSLDTSFDPGTGPNNPVQTTALQSDGKIIIGGWFTSYDGMPRNFIARVHSNGSIDSSFDSGTGVNGGGGPSVRTIVLQPDEKIIIGGQFTEYNSTPRNCLARIHQDGALDTSFDPGSGANDLVLSTALQPDGKTIIGGWFTSYNGTPRNYIARLADPTVGIEEIDVCMSHVFPNPTSGLLIIEPCNYGNAKSLTVQDATGRVVLMRAIGTTSASISVDLSDHENGLYLVQAHFADGIKVSRRVLKE